MPRGKSLNELTLWEAWVIHALTIGAGLVVAFSGVYFVWQLTLPIVLAGLLVAAVLGWMYRPTVRSRPSVHGEQSYQWLYALLALDTVIFFFILSAQTDRAIASPWQVVPIEVLLLYGVASWMLITLFRRASDRVSLVACISHAFVTWSVSLVVYRLGFGYDPFVHQATEQHILTQGFIHPKTPFYLGQYVTVVATALLTHLPVSMIDRVLVPLASTVMLPLIGFIGLRRGWMAHVTRPATGLIALFLIPIGYFAFTAPFNLSLIAFLSVIFCLPLVQERRIQFFLVAVGLASLAIHPLMGIPTSILVLAALLRKLRLSLWLPLVAIPCALVVAFFVYLRMQGAPIAWPPTGDGLVVFFSLFGNPYELYLGSQLLGAYYALLYVSPLILIGAGLHGLVTLTTEQGSTHDVIVKLLISTATGIVVAAMLVPFLFFIPNIISAEQFEFSLRLIAILPLLFLPGLSRTIHGLVQQKRLMAPIAIGLALLTSGVWYATYPQYNAIAYFPAPGLSQSDREAVQWIEKDANGSPYAVLSHQMMGAAALQKFGFARDVQTKVGSRYFYAIPTGGELYEFYLRLLSEDPNPSAVRDDLFTFIHAETVYVALPQSWDNEGGVDVRLRSLSETVTTIGELTVYKMKPANRE